MYARLKRGCYLPQELALPLSAVDQTSRILETLDPTRPAAPRLPDCCCVELDDREIECVHVAGGEAPRRITRRSSCRRVLLLD